MIAKVRIAPVEQWCEEAKRLGPPFLRPGMEVEIDTASMWLITNDETGEISRHWLCIGSSLEWVKDRWEANGLCEHVLEMD